MEKSSRDYEKCSKMDCAYCSFRYSCGDALKEAKKKKSSVNDKFQDKRSLKPNLILIHDLVLSFRELYEFDLISKEDYLELLYTVQEQVFQDIREADLWEDFMILGGNKISRP